LPQSLGVIAAEAAEVLLKSLGRATALLIGPGFGLEDTTKDFIDRLFGGQRTHRGGVGFVQAAGSSSNAPNKLPPVVIDADGLKLLARLANWPARLPPLSVLTPHPGEMAILTGLTTEIIQADRLGVAERFAREWGHVVVLKGAFTVISEPGGMTVVIPVATPALARAGTGDVLAGLIVGLRAQGLPAFQASIAGAWIHAQAGLRAAELMGSTAAVLAGDVLQAVPNVLASLQ
jgi:NAD(P)H-hydrate epimerase